MIELLSNATTGDWIAVCALSLSIINTVGQVWSSFSNRPKVRVFTTCDHYPHRHDDGLQGEQKGRYVLHFTCTDIGPVATTIVSATVNPKISLFRAKLSAINASPNYGRAPRQFGYDTIPKKLEPGGFFTFHCPISQDEVEFKPSRVWELRSC
ncbi:MAG: hypothetical protein ACK41Y_15080 [Paracoccus hibiscisoli]|uniref:hypothetical protein n=1 Tax=Paracoccus hibiscisoli TaxID=2023261 RepID=UPI00391A6F14